MVAASVIFLSLGFATGWYIVLYYLLKAFKLPIFWTKTDRKESSIPRLLFRALLNLDCLIASIFLGLLTTLTLMQVIIVSSSETSSIINSANNTAMRFNTMLFNQAALLSLLNIVIFSSLITFFEKLDDYFGSVGKSSDKEIDDDNSDNVSVSTFDELHNDNSKDNKLPTPTLESKASRSKAIEGTAINKELSTSSDKLLLDHKTETEKDNKKPRFDIFASPTQNKEKQSKLEKDKKDNSKDKSL